MKRKQKPKAEPDLVQADIDLGELEVDLLAVCNPKKNKRAAREETDAGATGGGVTLMDTRRIFGISSAIRLSWL